MYNIEDLEIALKRSGYLLENRISQALSDCKYFIKPNDTYFDSIAGKSREIDICAKSLSRVSKNMQVSFAINLVIECVNNLYPLILFKRKSERVDENIITGLRYYQTNIDNIVDLHIHEIGFNTAYLNDFSNSATQYCSFSHKNKKNELMANHPDEMNSILMKICYYIDQLIVRDIELFGKPEKYYRLWMYHPIIVLQNDVFEADIIGDKVKLSKVSEYPFEFSYSNKQNNTLFITILTENGFNGFIKKCMETEERFCEKLERIQECPWI